MPKKKKPTQQLTLPLPAGGKWAALDEPPTIPSSTPVAETPKNAWQRLAQFLREVEKIARREWKVLQGADLPSRYTQLRQEELEPLQTAAWREGVRSGIEERYLRDTLADAATALSAMAQAESWDTHTQAVRRCQATIEECLVIGDAMVIRGETPPHDNAAWNLDEPGRAYYRGIAVSVSGVQRRLLKRLIDAKGRGVSTNDLINAASADHDDGPGVEQQTLRGYIAQLRKLLRKQLVIGDNVDPIVNVDGGYRLALN